MADTCYLQHRAAAVQTRTETADVAATAPVQTAPNNAVIMEGHVQVTRTAVRAVVFPKGISAVLEIGIARQTPNAAVMTIVHPLEGSVAKVAPVAAKVCIPQLP